jgi:hypothetical protein
MSSVAQAHLGGYETGIAAAREQFQERLLPMFDEKDPRILGLFLIHFCAQGVGMTEPVPDWIRRAGENTRKRGFVELGKALEDHAAHEAGHHELMLDDTKSLVEWWNASYAPPLRAEEILALPWSKGVQAYRQLHEDYISGETPYCQIAIEYEIEKISVDYGPKVFGHVIQVVGPDVLACLSFITEHVALDVGHTHYNARALEQFLSRAPQALDPLVEAGADALDAYAGYLEDCMAMAKRYLAAHP